MNTSYLTVAKPAVTELVVERSRFIGYCQETALETEAKMLVSQIRSEHAGASHNCYAYRIGITEFPIEYFNDHGEPSGTAGKPILGGIQRLKLTNTLVVVTRYFGGKKLGVRGLIEAYGQAATMVLEQAGFTLRVPKFIVAMEYHYASHSLIQHRLQQTAAEVITTDFGELISVKLAIPEDNRGIFETITNELPILQIQYIDDTG